MIGLVVAVGAAVILLLTRQGNRHTAKRTAENEQIIRKFTDEMEQGTRLVKVMQNEGYTLGDLP